MQKEKALLILAERRKKWRESKRKQRQKIMCKSGD